MTPDFSSNLVQMLPVAYAHHKIILNENHLPVDYIFLDVNKAFEAMTGLKKEAVIGKRVTEVIPGLQSGKFDWIGCYGEVALTGKTIRITQHEEFLNRYYKVTAFSPETEHFVCLFEDITAEQRYIETLNEQNEKIEALSTDLELIFNNTQDAMFLAKHEDGKFYYVRNNLKHQQLTGFDSRRIVGKTLEDVWGSNTSRHLQHIERCVATREPVVYEEELALHGVNRIWLATVTPVIKNDRLIYIIGSRKDVTELRHLETEREKLAQQLESMFQNHTASMLMIEPDSGRILDANPAACAFYGYTKEELCSLKTEAINMLPAAELKRLRYEALQRNQRYFFFPHRLKNGEIRMVDVYSCPFDNGDQELLFSIVFDATDREQYRESLFREKELLRQTLYSIGDGVVTTDIGGRVTALNRVAQELSGWSEELAKGRPFHEVFRLKNEETGEDVGNPVTIVLRTGRGIGLANHTVLISRSGGRIPIADSAAPIKDENGQIFGSVMVFRDVSKDKQQREEILYLSYHDALTGLYNRRFIEEDMHRLDQAANLPLAVIMGDVNGLKITNDVFGHRMGDKLLKTVAEAFKENCRGADVIGRWGGDEFLILLPRTSREEAESITQRMRESFVKKSKGTLQLSVALGVAVATGARPLQNVLQEAEELMYHQKLLEGKSWRNSIINTLLSTLYEKSLETEEHAQRLQEHCLAIGERLGLSAEELNELSLLAILHDIGKVGIHQSILQKPGPLTPTEWLEMKRHPEIGFRIAQNAPELSVVSKYILYHHERWDGGGYPRGLRKEDTPLLCRILAVADAYDAMTNDRVYRKARSAQEAFQELRQNAGTQFDPKIVDLFIQLLSVRAGA